MGNRSSREKDCVFCNMSQKDVLFENERLFIINDIKPDAEHHYLVIPKEHIGNVNTLNASHCAIVREMISCGQQFLESILNEKEEENSSSNLLMGFHVPPFNSIEHLHMHCLSGNWKSLFSGFSFLENSWWFIKATRLLEVLHERKSKL